MGENEKYRVVYIDDNFHYMDPNERITGPMFSTGEEAVVECKRIVDESLRWLRQEEKDPDDPEKLYERYTNFGDDPFIRANGLDGPKFSAWTYAKERCKEIILEDTAKVTVLSPRTKSMKGGAYGSTSQTKS